MYTKCKQRYACDFVTCRKRYYNESREVYISALKHCSKMKLRTYINKQNFYVTVE